MLRVLPPTFKPVNILICCKTGLMWVVKRATSLFNSFCSNVARQVARLLLPVFPYLKVARHILSCPIPPKFEHKPRRHKESFGKIATTVVLDKDENLL